MQKYEIHPIRFNVGIHKYSNCCTAGSFIVVEPTAIGSSGAYLGEQSSAMLKRPRQRKSSEALTALKMATALSLRYGTSAMTTKALHMR